MINLINSVNKLNQLIKDFNNPKIITSYFLTNKYTYLPIELIEYIIILSYEVDNTLYINRTIKYFLINTHLYNFIYKKHYLKIDNNKLMKIYSDVSIVYSILDKYLNGLYISGSYLLNILSNIKNNDIDIFIDVRKVYRYKGFKLIDEITKVEDILLKYGWKIKRTCEYLDFKIYNNDYNNIQFIVLEAYEKIKFIIRDFDFSIVKMFFKIKNNTIIKSYYPYFNNKISYCDFNFSTVERINKYIDKGIMIINFTQIINKINKILKTIDKLKSLMFEFIYNCYNFDDVFNGVNYFNDYKIKVLKIDFNNYIVIGKIKKYTLKIEWELIKVGKKLGSCEYFKNKRKINILEYEKLGTIQIKKYK